MFVLRPVCWRIVPYFRSLCVVAHPVHKAVSVNCFEKCQKNRRQRYETSSVLAVLCRDICQSEDSFSLLFHAIPRNLVSTLTHTPSPNTNRTIKAIPKSNHKTHLPMLNTTFSTIQKHPPRNEFCSGKKTCRIHPNSGVLC